MERVEFLNRLHELFESDPGSIHANLALQDIPGWDSLTFLGLLAMIDEQYRTVVAPHDVLRCHTVEDLFSLIMQRRRKHAA